MVAQEPSSSNTVLILSSSKLRFDVMVPTRNQDYGNVNPLNGHAIDQPTNSTPTSYDSIMPPELTIKTPKGIIHKSSFNPRSRASKNYNVVEDLAQSP